MPYMDPISGGNDHSIKIQRICWREASCKFGNIEKKHHWYRKGITGKLAEYAARKYKSHRCIPEYVLSELNKIKLWDGIYVYNDKNI